MENRSLTIEEHLNHTVPFSEIEIGSFLTFDLENSDVHLKIKDEQVFNMVTTSIYKMDLDTPSILLVAKLDVYAEKTF
jgi:hypothetical protein